ncbi:MAG: L,D-transpeptidase [Chitinophagales bacterium]|nr:L,D-transpeptidase [Chitinophagales bacterium]
MIYRLGWITVVLLIVQGCNNTAKPKVDKKSEQALNEVAVIAPPPVITYHLMASKDFAADTASDTFKIVLALNRVDKAHYLRADSLVVPDTFYTDLLVYSPFPKHLPFLADIKKLMFCSYRAEAFGVYQNGELIKWGPCSMGKKATPTPTGLFHTNWRSKKTTSTVNSDWVMEWYFNLENRLGVSMHQFDLPGYPASHACVRLYKEDAMWLYTWCDQWLTNNDRIGSIRAYGTPVIIFGSYAFGQRRPWLDMAVSKDTLMLGVDDMLVESNQYLQLIRERQYARDSVLAQQPLAAAVSKEQQPVTKSKP